MHGLLMSLKSWTVTMKERERKKTSHTASPWGFFGGDVVWGHPAGPAETLLLLQNANYLVRGPFGSPPHSPPLPSPLFC